MLACSFKLTSRQLRPSTVLDVWYNPEPPSPFKYRLCSTIPPQVKFLSYPSSMQLSLTTPPFSRHLSILISVRIAL